MFRALLCPSSGARDYDVDYHIGRVVLGLLYAGGKVRLGWSSVWAAGFNLQPRHYSNLTAPYLQHTINQERHDQCGNQHRSRELLMMGIVISRWFFYSSVITMMHGPINIRSAFDIYVLLQTLRKPAIYLRLSSE